MTKKKPSLFEALIPVLFLIGMLAFNILYVFGDAALDGSNQIILILSATVATLVAFRLGHTWAELQKGIISSINSAMPSILILLMIGALAGSWLISGIIPSMIYYGLDLLNPTIFLVASCVISAIVSLATGSSWTTIATIGVALLGIGKALGVPEGMVAGAIISGAYFGDKMSPMSDTTNLAPAMAGTDLFTHIKYMTKTTVPTFVITIVIFIVLGFTFDSSGNADVSMLQSAISEKFNITPVLFLVPIFLLVLIIKKMPALPSLLLAAIAGSVFALIFQPEVVKGIGGESSSLAITYFKGLMSPLFQSTSIVTSNSEVNELLSSSGMSGMLNTIWLILCAMIFGGVMESAGLLERITQSIIRLAHSTGSLIASTVGTCVVFNVTASDQYLAIVVPGRMYADTFRNRNLKPEVLSRSLEDAGTVTSVLIPWNTCGAYQASVLGVATMAYAPYCFFNLLSPIVNIIFGYIFVKPEPIVEGNELNKEEVSLG
ncbi:NhaC family Na+:H+ antiporter [Aureibacter tunicatorum]|uniref:NhaC family Na+:H+ antiporter n=2 Tax=Aureibacter tunicatorum TaxID=866807 RepID=A0AAE3XLI3_9BACT|nr:NhaC family Na+:H+ antiporter [Aureibacter tunicatorum]BDD03173.1 sodium:proton antiporter [Aureibacter tunicatorum]